jgi:hypothetical protein
LNKEHNNLQRKVEEGAVLGQKSLAIEEFEVGTRRPFTSGTGRLVHNLGFKGVRTTFGVSRANSDGTIRV